MSVSVFRTIPASILAATLWLSPAVHAGEDPVVKAMEDYLEFADYMGGTIFPRQIARGEFPKDKMILLYCNSGTLSAQGALALKLAGVENVLVLQGGFNQWKEEGGFDASRRATQPAKH